MPINAVLLDALGTLVCMQPPAPRLRDELARLGHPVSDSAAEEAMAAEIAYYLEHHLEGRDSSSLAELRNRCAAVLRDHLGLPGLGVTAAREALLAALHFEPYPDVRPALATLREAGLKLVVASNWDCSLRDVLANAGIAELVDGVVTSADVGGTKPDPAVFNAALQIADRPANETVHVGDSPENDLAGAEAAGLRAILVRRTPEPVPTDDTPAIASLAELPALLL